MISQETMDVINMLVKIIHENDLAMPDPVNQQWLGSPMRQEALDLIKRLVG
jgi:hypothetical protein